MELSATPDAFFDTVLARNPFDSNRMTPVSSDWADAADIYREPFQRLLDGIDRVQRERSALGVLLWGEAGIGKSHLLGRLEHWAQTDPTPALVLSLSNLQAEPERLPRALLRGVLDLLAAGRARIGARTPLFRIVNGMARKAVEEEKPLSEAGTQRRYLGLVEELCREAPGRAAVLDRGIFQILFRFLLSSLRLRNRGEDDGIAHAAIRYLRGDGIESDEARRLGLSPSSEGDRIVALADDEQVKKVLVALSQAAWFWGRPMILALDQVDNLEPAQFHALGRFLHALLDAAANLVVVTSGVRETLFHWREQKVLQTSSWERIAQETVELQRLSPSACAPVVEARLRTFLAPLDVDGILQEQLRRDPLFPLGSPWLQQRLQDRTDARPRDLIHWARAAWEQQQTALRDKGGRAWLEEWRSTQGASGDPEPLTPRRVEEWIDEAVRARLLALQEKKKSELESLDWDPEALADRLHDLAKLWVKREGWPLLRGVERVRVNGSRRASLHLLLHQRMSAAGPDLKRGVACLLGSGRTGVTGQLRRLVQGTLPQQLIVLHEQRSGFQLGEKGREYWEDLTARLGEEARLLAVDLDEQARLAALNALLREAASGEVEAALSDNDAHRLSRDETLESLVRQDLFPGDALLNLLLRMGLKPEQKPAAVGQATSGLA